MNLDRFDLGEKGVGMDARGVAPKA
jgi:hypothetical protein